VSVSTIGSNIRAEGGDCFGDFPKSFDRKLIFGGGAVKPTNSPTASGQAFSVATCSGVIRYRLHNMLTIEVSVRVLMTPNAQDHLHAV
jgi:hypothetical protein